MDTAWPGNCSAAAKTPPTPDALAELHDAQQASDIARTLDIDPNAAHQLLHRAKQALRTHLQGASP